MRPFNAAAPFGMKELLLTRGMTALVDEEDFESLSSYKWNAQPRRCDLWYAARNRNAVERKLLGGRGIIYLHRQIMNALKGTEIDHRNGNGLDCRRANMRFATSRQNKANGRPKRSKRTSTFKGVYWGTRERRWLVQIRLPDGRRLGKGFNSENEAASYYTEIARKIHGEFARST